MATNVTGEVFDVEERLFMALATGPLEQYKDLLNSLGDVDVQGLKQRTLLHVAVKLGKVDWVEGLLGKGGNPGLRDVDGESVVELAQGMAEKYPEAVDRKLIHKLVLVAKIARDSAGIVSLGGSSSNTSGCIDTGMEAMRQEISVLSRKITSILESINDIQSRMAAKNIHLQEMTTIRNSLDDVKTIREKIDTLTQDMATIRISIDDVKSGMAARDVLLSALESSVTSLANNERPLAGTSATSITAEEDVPSTPRTEEEIRKECVEAMVRMTRILRSDDGRVKRARGLYKKLYALGDETACVLKYMKSQENVSIEIDFDSDDIGEKKSKLRDHNGVEREGSGYLFADFKERKVYLAGGHAEKNEIIARLAAALSQLAFFLAFGNGGRPYARGDDVIGRELESAIKEAEEENRRSAGKRDGNVRLALGSDTQLWKEIYCTSCVPAIIALHGCRDGTSIMQREIPSLLRFFRENVMPALLAKAQA